MALYNPSTIRISAPARKLIREALTAEAGWNNYRERRSLDLSGMSKEDYCNACEFFDIDLNAIIARAASEGEDAPAPTPAPELPAIYDVPLASYRVNRDAFAGHYSNRDWKLTEDIFAKCETYHAGNMTAKQAALVSTIITRGQEAHAIAAGKPNPDQLPKDAPNMPIQPATPAPAPDAAAMAQAISAAVMGAMSGFGMNEARVLDLIKENAGRPAHVLLDLRPVSGPAIPKGEALIHWRFPLLFSAVNAGVNVMLVGPAGSGKTTACEQIAHMTDREFHFTGAIDSAYKLSGFIDAQGRIVHTAFRRAYEHGHLFLFDEMDGSLPGAVLAFNAALANGHADFPDGMVKRHPNFRAVAACNTFGRGADRQYVGRLQLDAASLDRFATIEWNYDAALECAMIGAPRPSGAPDPVSIVPIDDAKSVQREAVKWLSRVTKVRAAVDTAKVRHVVSPRATIMGSKLLAAGWTWDDVEASVLWKGLDADNMAKVKAAL